jgi:hypothetical protein
VCVWVVCAKAFWCCCASGFGLAFCHCCCFQRGRWPGTTLHLHAPWVIYLAAPEDISRTENQQPQPADADGGPRPACDQTGSPTWTPDLHVAGCWKASVPPSTQSPSWPWFWALQADHHLWRMWSSCEPPLPHARTLTGLQPSRLPNLSVYPRVKARHISVLGSHSSPPVTAALFPSSLPPSFPLGFVFGVFCFGGFFLCFFVVFFGRLAPSLCCGTTPHKPWPPGESPCGAHAPLQELSRPMETLTMDRQGGTSPAIPPGGSPLLLWQRPCPPPEVSEL